MNKFVILLLPAVLASCGADGAPFRPTQSASLSLGTNGVSAQTNLGMTNGTLSLGLGQSISR